VITGTYTGKAVWQSLPIKPGTPLETPTPLFTKIDPQAADDELTRLASYSTEPQS
jgi:methionyl-tRNA synthetase